MFSKFRVSNHKLEIEFGRCKNVPREDFVNTATNVQLKTNFTSHAFECNKYENLRNYSHNILKDYFKMNITGELKRKLLSDLMSLNDPVITDLFSRHISKCFYIRDNSP